MATHCTCSKGKGLGPWRGTSHLNTAREEKESRKTLSAQPTTFPHAETLTGGTASLGLLPHLLRHFLGQMKEGPVLGFLKIVVMQVCRQSVVFQKERKVVVGALSVIGPHGLTRPRSVFAVGWNYIRPGGHPGYLGLMRSPDYSYISDSA